VLLLGPLLLLILDAWALGKLELDIFFIVFGLLTGLVAVTFV
jgi:hypothetical protein